MYIIMYWNNWSFGKERMSSNLEQLLDPPSKKPTFFEKYFTCFQSVDNTDKFLIKKTVKNVHFHDNE